MGDVCDMNLELLRLLEEEALAAADPVVAAELSNLFCDLADELRRGIELWHEFDRATEKRRRREGWKLLERPPTRRELRYRN